MFKREKSLKAVSIALSVAMLLTAALNVFGFTLRLSGNAPSATESIVKEGSFQKVDIDTGYLREQYINQELLQKNIASYDGEQWMLVELEGDNLYDKFKKSSRYNSFTDYISSAEGQKALAAIEAEQQRFLSKLAKNGIQYELRHTYNTVNNGVAIKISASACNTIRNMSGVDDVYYSENYAVPKVAVVNDAHVYTTGIYDTKEFADSYQGEGMAVAILDTGLDYTHEAFTTNILSEEDVARDPSKVRYTREEIAGIIGKEDLNATGTVDDLYISTKVPFAYDYADRDPNVYPSYESHGTHVAGIVAGQSDYVVNNGLDGIKGTPDDETFRGVAPGAQLVICKVFTDNLDDESIGGASTMDILAALQDCVKLGVDVINMSLGSSAGFADDKSNTFINNVYASIRNLGISLVCAASNDYSSGFGGGNGTNLSSNPDSGTVGSPSTYAAAISVASINGQKSKYITAGETEDQNNPNPENPVAFITNASDGDGNRIEFIDALYEKLGIADKTRMLRLKYVVIGGVGRGTDYVSKRNLLNNRNYNGTTVDGVIAMVKRGDITFEEKVQYAMNNGADAVIIYNNVSGTLNMSLGEIEDPIPTCLITMDAANAIIAKTERNQGIINVSYNFEAGPFMSDFSSWGPMADLQLKPEITAHGGEITSAVAGGYNIYSGTSMAAPNMAGAIALLRQFLKEELYPEKSANGDELTAEEARALNARVFQQLMSTATIARNEDDNPYSPRKQGAGLANISNAIHSQGYLTVNDASGNERDKTKVELYDDPAKKGVYEFKFDVHNTSEAVQTYNLSASVMTETMASDNKTVAEKAYILNQYCDITFKVGGVEQNSVSVQPGQKVEVAVSITLKAEARAYLDANFANGMYVEGFVNLDNTVAGNVSLGLPYLAFYGDWTDAPLFDYDQYEIAESEADTSVDPEDKLKASAAATRIYGLYYKDRYYLPMGTFIYTQDENAVQVLPDRDKIAVSMFDEDDAHTVYEVSMVYAGMLRNAGHLNIVIENAATGEVLISDLRENIRKGYAAGGANRGAMINLEIDPYSYNLQNNDVYNVYIVGELDYNHTDDYVVYDEKYEKMTSLYEMSADGNSFKNIGDDSLEIGKTYYFIGNGFLTTQDHDTEEFTTELKQFYPAKNENSFEFQFAVDYQEPEVVDYRLRYEPYTEYNQTKYRIYADLDIYDNQYVMSVLPCYVGEDKVLGQVLTMMNEYATPVYGEKNSVTTVSVEVTDYYDDYVLNGDFYFQIEDYAMNSVVIRILPQAFAELPEAVRLISTGSNDRLSYTGDSYFDSYDHEYFRYNLTLQPNELYHLNALVSPSDVVLDSLTWEASSIVGLEPSETVGKGSEIFAGSKVGSRTLRLVDTRVESTDDPHIYAIVDVKVEGDPLTAPTPDRLSIAPIENSDRWVVVPEGGLTTVEMNPNTTVNLHATVSPWYVSDVDYVWESSRPDIATITPDGTLKTIKKGTTIITAKATHKDGTPYNRVEQSVNIVVGEEFNVRNYYLYNYYGGPVCVIPDKLNVMYLDEDCFKNDTTIEEVYLPGTLMEIPVGAFTGCTNLRKVVIPSSCLTINHSAFEGCTNLTTIEFETFEDMYHKPVVGNDGKAYKGSVALGRRAFAGCTKLDTIGNQQRLSTLYDSAFEGCTALTSIDLSQLRVVGSNVFRDCTNLSQVTTTAETALGEGMFEGCTALREFELKGNVLPASAFKNASNLATFTFANDNMLSIGSEALRGTAIGNITLPGGDYTIGYNAFSDIANLNTVTIGANTKLTLAGQSPFLGSENFKTFEVAAGNPYYEAEGGVVYNETTKDTVVAVPTYKDKESFELLSSVTTIGRSAFSGNQSITNFDLTGKKVEAYAFAYSNLESVTLPAEMTVVPEGLFMGCEKLATVTGLDNVQEVGDYAFANCKAITAINLDNATTVGERAFFGTTELKTLTAPKLESVGRYSFAQTGITEVNLPKLTTIRYGAFAGNTSLTSVDVGAITVMEPDAFFNSAMITTAKFAVGTTVIGDFAFMVYTDSGLQASSLITVNLPDTVETIGSQAFVYAHLMKYINLKGVKVIGLEAFGLTGLENSAPQNGAGQDYRLDLSNLEIIGVAAFYGSDLTGTLDLSKAEQIGESAFAYTNLTGVTFDNLVYLGYGAFDNADLRTVELPESFQFSQIDYIWQTYDYHGNVEYTYIRREETFKAGFTNNTRLSSISVADDSNAYFTDSYGVLYSRLDDGGYVLEQAPAGMNAISYKVLDGTRKIDDFAFAGMQYLDTIELPYTVKSIGDGAFYGSSVRDFTFNSVDAPLLLAAYSEDNVYATGYTQFYRNFYDYSVEGDELYWIPGFADDFGLTLHIPLNGRGYDTHVWQAFFKHIYRSEENMPDDTTNEALELIEVMPDKAAIEAKITDASFTREELEAQGGIADQVRQAREAYNKIKASDQIELAKEALNKLLDAEAALRKLKKEKFGDTVLVARVEGNSTGMKSRYKVGETFDPTGFELRVVYEDGSEITVYGGDAKLVFDKTVINAGDSSATATYVDENGTEWTYTVMFNVDQDVNPSNPDNPNQPGGSTGGSTSGGSSGLSTGAIVGIVIGCVAAVLIVVAAVVLILFKKKRGSQPKSDGSKADNDNKDGKSNAGDNDASEAVAESGNEAPASSNDDIDEDDE